MASINAGWQEYPEDWQHTPDGKLTDYPKLVPGWLLDTPTGVYLVGHRDIGKRWEGGRITRYRVVWQGGRD